MLLEDDYEYQISVKEYLQNLGYEVDEVGDGIEACDKIAKNSYHLLILDIKVPEISGHEVMKYAKNLNLQTPIMIMTSLTNIEDIATGYKLGCNEYLKKPFNLAELKFRVNELMGKYYSQNDKNIIKIADKFDYDTNLKQIKNAQNIVNLSQKEISLIDFLLSRIGMFSSINDIKYEIWEDKEIDDARIRMHIKNIRNKTSNDFIISHRGMGYKINV